MNKIRTVLILVELDNGHVHQVLAQAELKAICVNLLKTDGEILISERLMPVVLEPFAEKKEVNYAWRDLGGGDPVRVQHCPKCGVAPSNVDDCGEFGDPDCPYFGIGREEFERRQAALCDTTGDG